MTPIYARVWRAKWSAGTTPASMNVAKLMKLDDEPLGQVCVTDDNPCWIKINGKWINPLNPISLPQIVLEGIPQAAYESDLEFGLWDELPITYRPVRSWLKKNKAKIKSINYKVACVTTILFGVINAISDKHMNGLSTNDWEFWVGWFSIACAAHAVGTVLDYIIPGLPDDIER